MNESSEFHGLVLGRRRGKAINAGRGGSSTREGTQPARPAEFAMPRDETYPAANEEVTTVGIAAAKMSVMIVWWERGGRRAQARPGLARQRRVRLGELRGAEVSSGKQQGVYRQ